MHSGHSADPRSRPYTGTDPRTHLDTRTAAIRAPAGFHRQTSGQASGPVGGTYLVLCRLCGRTMMWILSGRSCTPHMENQSMATPAHIMTDQQTIHKTIRTTGSTDPTASAPPLPRPVCSIRPCSSHSWSQSCFAGSRYRLRPPGGRHDGLD